ncbi:MAG: hypothetical protein IJ667_10440 [Synergistaceae bacterium]|nr:hypothetical protein [Synergistaceae bacterium]
MSNNGRNKSVSGVVIDERVLDMIFIEILKYEEFLRTPQEKAQYRRKLKEYRDNIRAKAKESEASESEGEAE